MRKNDKLACLFIFLSLLFLFYPGDSYYVRLFSFNRSLFITAPAKTHFREVKVPYLLNPVVKPALTAKSVYVVDLESFTPVLEKNEHIRYSPASTTKIITALTAENIFLPQSTLTVKRSFDEGQIIGLVMGEKITFENLLYGLLVASGNDAAYAIADNHSLGLDDFVVKMNETAKSLNMKDSEFKNPAGLDDFGQHTSAYDLALAARALLADSFLAKIVSIKQITVSDADFKIFHDLKNINKLLGEIPGIGGLKTGYTEDAGENLVTFYKKNNHKFIVVVLGSEDRFEDTTRIVTWINSNVDYFILDEAVY